MKIYIIRHGEIDANKEGQLHHAETNDKSSFHLRTLLFSDTVNITKNGAKHNDISVCEGWRGITQLFLAGVRVQDHLQF